MADKTWKGVVAVAAASGVDLQAHAWTYPIPPGAGGDFQYNTFGAAVAEVELDVLTKERSKSFNATSSTIADRVSILPSTSAKLLEAS